MSLPELKNLHKKLQLQCSKQCNQTISNLTKKSELLYTMDCISMSTQGSASLTVCNASPVGT
jgi:hypothetical protein